MGSDSIRGTSNRLPRTAFTRLALGLEASRFTAGLSMGAATRLSPFPTGFLQALAAKADASFQIKRIGIEVGP
jgi:hypothetical protein